MDKINTIFVESIFDMYVNYFFSLLNSQTIPHSKKDIDLKLKFLFSNKETIIHFIRYSLSSDVLFELMFNNKIDNYNDFVFKINFLINILNLYYFLFIPIFLFTMQLFYTSIILGIIGLMLWIIIYYQYTKFLFLLSTNNLLFTLNILYIILNICFAIYKMYELYLTRKIENESNKNNPYIDKNTSENNKEKTTDTNKDLLTFSQIENVYSKNNIKTFDKDFITYSIIILVVSIIMYALYYFNNYKCYFSNTITYIPYKNTNLLEVEYERIYNKNK
jgi:hypothetical protein